MKTEYERDTTVDHNALDVMWVDQPTLMGKYTKKLAEAEKEVDRLEERLGIKKAKLDRDIRTDPESFGIHIKLTEALILGEIAMDREYKKLRAEFIEAKYEKKMLQGAVKAIEHRKDSIEGLAKLLGQNYFAGPKSPRDLNHELNVQRQQDKAGRANIKIKKKNKKTRG
jgi:hypothetical protein